MARTVLGASLVKLRKPRVRGARIRLKKPRIKGLRRRRRRVY